jgi:hypothetical protein
MIRIAVHLRNEPMASLRIAGRAKSRPVSTGEHPFNQQLEIKPTKSQHQKSPLVVGPLSFADTGRAVWRKAERSWHQRGLSGDTTTSL